MIFTCVRMGIVCGGGGSEEDTMDRHDRREILASCCTLRNSTFFYCFPKELYVPPTLCYGKEKIVVRLHSGRLLRCVDQRTGALNSDFCNRVDQLARDNHVDVIDHVLGPIGSESHWRTTIRYLRTFRLGPPRSSRKLSDHEDEGFTHSATRQTSTDTWREDKPVERS